MRLREYAAFVWAYACDTTPVRDDSIEHLPENILPDFAPVLLGLYHPRMLLITTPSYTFNARFTPPDAPPGTRKGFLDPTGRTDRIFRHDDHKFEWTVEEFTRWCCDVAETWDYEVEISGVGRSQEDDPWGRDAELGFASQTAAFLRKEGAEYIERRVRKCQTLGLMQNMIARVQHVLLADHSHMPHPTAKRPAPASEIVAAVKNKMEEFKTGTLTIRELWFEQEVSTLCGGWVEVLVAAVNQQEDFILSQKHTGHGYTWEVLFSGFVPRSPSPTTPADVRLDEDAMLGSDDEGGDEDGDDTGESEPRDTHSMVHSSWFSSGNLDWGMPDDGEHWHIPVDTGSWSWGQASAVNPPIKS